MKFLPFTNLGRKLRPEYRSPLTALIFIFILAAFGVTIWFAFWLARDLGIRDDLPLKIQPDADLWGFLLLGFFITAMLTFYLASFAVMAVVLKLFYRWPSDKIRELIFESRIPPHWFNDQ
jgi:hypothetical protein